MSTPNVDLENNTVTHAGKTFVMRPLGDNSFTMMIDGVPVGRAVYTFGAANGVAEGDTVDEDTLTEVAAAWFEATGE